MRMDKFLTQLKYTTRSQIKDFLKQHVVMKNHQVVKNPKDDINPNVDILTIDGHKVFYQEDVHLMLYKPKGYLSANKDNMHPCAVDLIKEPYHRFEYAIAGRLDLDAEGLLILTTDGTLVHDITSPKKHLPKVYEVKLDQPFTLTDALTKGVTIKDGKDELYVAKAIDLIVNEDVIYITIDEGKFHQVKRMFQAIGYEVTHLKRIQIGNLKLGDLLPGEYIEFHKEQLL
jgi:16S rRNA pseudouridine516 synthase